MIATLIAVILLLSAGSLLYRTRYHYTEIDAQTSPDGRCLLVLEMRGEPEWPFGATYGRIRMQYDGEIVGERSVALHDDGAVLRPENWSIAWGRAGAEVTLMGSEQEDQVLELLYDGTERFAGYSDRDIVAEIGACL